MVEMKNGKEIDHKVRLSGDYAHKPAGDVHMEYAGDSGSLVLFNLYAPDGRLFEILNKDEETLAVATTSDFVNGQLPG